MYGFNDCFCGLVLTDANNNDIDCLLLTNWQVTSSANEFWIKNILWIFYFNNFFNCLNLPFQWVILFHEKKFFFKKVQKSKWKFNNRFFGNASTIWKNKKLSTVKCKVLFTSIVAGINVARASSFCLIPSMNFNICSAYMHIRRSSSTTVPLHTSETK